MARGLCGIVVGHRGKLLRAVCRIRTAWRVSQAPPECVYLLRRQCICMERKVSLHSSSCRARLGLPALTGCAAALQGASGTSRHWRSCCWTVPGWMKTSRASPRPWSTLRHRWLNRAAWHALAGRRTRLACDCPHCTLPTRRRHTLLVTKVKNSWIEKHKVRGIPEQRIVRVTGITERAHTPAYVGFDVFPMPCGA